MTITDPSTGSPTTGVLTSVIISALAPIFLTATDGDITLARLAVTELIDEHQARNQTDLIAVGQIIANSLAALGSLGQSMTNEISLSMALRLRGNAISLNRNVQQNQRARRENRHADPVPLSADIDVEPAPPQHIALDQVDPFLQDDVALFLAAEAAARLTTPAEQPAEPAPTAVRPSDREDQRLSQIQAMAMLQEAGTISASLPTLPPAERERAAIRVTNLGNAARELIIGERPPPSARTGGKAIMNGSA